MIINLPLDLHLSLTAAKCELSLVTLQQGLRVLWPAAPTDVKNDNVM